MFKSFTILFVLTILFYSCAQQGSPTGGAKDEDPPVVVEAKPSNYSNNFDAEKIFITFDEFIVLDNVNQELIISPPFDEKPEIKLRKKTIIIQFEEGLRENTTYTFNFGNAIKDLHEGNKLVNFEYVFATGEELDSLSVRGTLKNSFDHSIPEEAITIMLYDDLSDSVPLNQTPLYVGKSGPEGAFSVNNLKSEVFKIFAIKDANYNFLFDQPNEEIAFLDSNLIVSAEYFRQTLTESGSLDSIKSLIDSLQIMADSAIIDADSLKQIMPNLNAVYVDLFLFTEASETQFLTDYKREDPRRLELLFNRPLTDSFDYHLVDSDLPNDELFLEIFSKERDSLILWIADSTYYKRDTLAITYTYTVRDSLNNPVSAIDSLPMNFRKREEKKSKKKTEITKSVEIEKLEIKPSISGGKQDLNIPLGLKFDFPVTDIDTKLIELFQMPDSVEFSIDFSVSLDSSKYLTAFLHHTWESDMKYGLRIFPGAIKNLYDLPHDTIDVAFAGKDVESYGKIILNLENVKGELIIQLLSGDKVYIRKTVSSDGTYEFPYLKPGTFKIKFIHDKNGNGKWDTGKYIKKLQPEKVEFLPIDITVRANWDHDATHVMKN